jgi:hypothetical protein
MNKPGIAISILSALCISCNHNGADSGNKDNFYSLKLKIIGKWGGPDGPPGLKITMDSIYLFNLDSAYSYSIMNDTLFIKFPGRDTATVLGKMSVNKDTLTWVDRDGFKTFAYRSK